MSFNFNANSKRKLNIHNIGLCIVGSMLLAFGTAIFLSKNTLVSGGLSGIAFIIQYYIKDFQIIDIVVWVANFLFLILSFFTLDKRFTLSTLIASLAYPAFLTLFLRVPAFDQISNVLIGTNPNDVAFLLLDAIFGGLINGIGLALTFLGKGSTGGLDVLSFLVKKHFGIEVALTSLVCDITIIITGIFALDFPKMIPNCLCGIICAVFMAIMITLLYNRKQNAFIMDVISKKTEEIITFITETLDRSATLIDVTGAYSKEKKVMIRCVLSKGEYYKIKDQIAMIDDKAFVTFTDTSAVFGEGFQVNIRSVDRFKVKRKKEK